MKNYIKLYFCTVFLLFALSFSSVANATVVGGDKYQSGQTYINFFSNHGYFSRDLPFKFVHETEIFDYIREKFVLENKIQDFPILIVLPETFGSGSANIEIKIENNCEIGFAEGMAGEPIGKCYQIIKENGYSYKEILVALLSLQNLNTENPKIVLENLAEAKTKLTADLGKFQSISQDFDPIWSPDSMYFVYTHWQDGDVSFELVDVAQNKIKKLAGSNGYMIRRPLWSDASKYLAYASLNEIKIFNLENGKTDTINLGNIYKGFRNEVLMSFNYESGKLAFVADQNLLDIYTDYVYDLTSGSIDLIPKGEYTFQPKWETYQIPELSHMDTQALTSPNGSYLAVIKEVDGLKRIEVKNLNDLLKEADAADSSLAVSEININSDNNINQSPLNNYSPFVNLQNFILMYFVICLICIVLIIFIIYIVIKKK